jgi:hypothetical protein
MHLGLVGLLIGVGALAIWAGVKAAQWDLGGRTQCWLGLHWWCYADDRHRRCLRGYCGHKEENLGLVGRAERWVTYE